MPVVLLPIVVALIVEFIKISRLYISEAVQRATGHIRFFAYSPLCLSLGGLSVWAFSRWMHKYVNELFIGRNNKPR